MKKQNKKIGVVLHGECMVFESTLPAGAKPVTKKGPYHVVAPSETTGNHHVVDHQKENTFFEADGKLFLDAQVPTSLRCVHADRHDTVELGAGTYEFGMQQEYDYFSESHRAVRD